MLITLCKTTDDNRRVLKRYNSERQINMNPVSETNILNPTFTVDYDESLLSYNYAYITFDNIKRYYFVSPPEIIQGGRLMFQFNVDVLMTAGLVNCTGVFTRNERVNNYEFEDKLLPLVYGRQGDFIRIDLPLNTEGPWPPWIFQYLWFDYLLTR